MKSDQCTVITQAYALLLDGEEEARHFLILLAFMTTSFQVFEANLDCFPLVLFKQDEIFQVHLQAVCDYFFFFFLHNTMEF